MRSDLHGPTTMIEQPKAAGRLRAARERVGARALEIATTADPTLGGRLGEEGLRRLQRDTEAFLERVARSLETGDVEQTREWADWVAPLYRRRHVPMRDAIALAEALRTATAGVLEPSELEVADAAFEAAVTVFKRYHRIAGDARKRNSLIWFLYKGAGS